MTAAPNRIRARSKTVTPPEPARDGSHKQTLWRKPTNPRTWSDLLKRYEPEGDLGEAKNKHLLPPPQSEGAEFNPLCQLKALAGQAPQSPPAGASFFGDVMTSDDRLSLILRRLDEIERKLDHMLEELRTPAAIGYSARRGNRPRKD